MTNDGFGKPPPRGFGYTKTGYIFGPVCPLKSPKSGQNSRDPSLSGVPLDNRSLNRSQNPSSGVPLRPVSTHSLHTPLHMTAIRLSAEFSL